MIVIALFRNFNQGQAGTPRAAELVDIFRSLGAEDARPVRSNGTVAVRARDSGVIVNSVRDEIAAHSSWSDVVLVRSSEWIDHLAAHLAQFAPNAESAFFDSPLPFPHRLPWRPNRGRITVHHADASHAICTNDEPGTSYGTPTLEQLLALPVTSRGADTVVRAAATARQMR